MQSESNTLNKIGKYSRTLNFANWGQICQVEKFVNKNFTSLTIDCLYYRSIL